MLNEAIKAAGIATLAIALVGCGSNEPGSQAVPEQSAEVSARGAEAAQGSDNVAGVGRSVADSNLAAGLKVMQPRLLSTEGGLGDVIVMPEHRFLMHPDLGRPSVATFDLSGLSSVTLSPKIKDLSADADCLANADAGLVMLSWNAGPNASGTQQIDRNFDQLIELKLEGVDRLELQVDDGNGSITCDWFTIGFLNAV